MPTRRALLAAGATAGALAACGRPAVAAVAASGVGVARAAGLHARAQRKGLFFGAGLGSGPPHADTDLLARFPAECGLIAADTGFAQIHPRAEQYAFEHADLLAAYAGRHSLRLHGGPLLSRRPLPGWIEPALAASHAERLLVSHVERVVRHLHRHAAQWEVLGDLLDASEPLGLAASAWTRALGPRMIDIACHACAAADPRALRVWSEPGLCYADPGAVRARQTLLRLAAAARERGVPLQAIGLQARLTAGRAVPEAASLAGFCDSVGALGLKVMVIGLEVDDRALPAERAVRDAGVAAQADALLAGLVGHPAFLGVICAGLSDRQSRLAAEAPRPLPLDRELRRKRLWQGLADAFDAAPGRPKTGAPPLDPAKG